MRFTKPSLVVELSTGPSGWRIASAKRSIGSFFYGRPGSLPKPRHIVIRFILYPAGQVDRLKVRLFGASARRRQRVLQPVSRLQTVHAGIADRPGNIDLEFRLNVRRPC